MEVKCKDADFNLGPMAIESLLKGIGKRLMSMSGQQLLDLIGEGMIAENGGEVAGQHPIIFAPEEIDLITKACYTARQHYQAEKYEASEEGDYETVGEMDDMANRMWSIIAKIKTSQR